MILKSITGRTVAELTVGEKGDVVVKVFRNGQCINDFSVPGEDGLGIHTELRKRGDGSVEIWQDGPRGIRVLEGVYRNGIAVIDDPVALSPSSTG